MQGAKQDNNGRRLSALSENEYRGVSILATHPARQSMVSVACCFSSFRAASGEKHDTPYFRSTQTILGPESEMSSI